MIEGFRLACGGARIFSLATVCWGLTRREALYPEALLSRMPFMQTPCKRA